MVLATYTASLSAPTLWYILLEMSFFSILVISLKDHLIDVSSTCGQLVSGGWAYLAFLTNVQTTASTHLLQVKCPGKPMIRWMGEQTNGFHAMATPMSFMLLRILGGLKGGCGAEKASSPELFSVFIPGKPMRDRPLCSSLILLKRDSTRPKLN